jgi:hypothetical protein
MISFRMKPVKAEFMQHENGDQDATGQPNGQSSKIDKGIRFMSQYIPEKNIEEVAYHGSVI